MGGLWVGCGWVVGFWKCVCIHTCAERRGSVMVSTST